MTVLEDTLSGAVSLAPVVEGLTDTCPLIPLTSALVGLLLEVLTSASPLRPGVTGTGLEVATLDSDPTDTHPEAVSLT